MLLGHADLRQLESPSGVADLAARNSGFRRVLEATRIVQWEADPYTRDFTYVGLQAERLLAYPLGQWYTPAFWRTHIHVNDRPRVLEFRQEALREQESYELEYRMVAATGENVWVHDVIMVERVDDTPTVIRGFLIDISKRKRAEDRFRIAVSLGADIVAEVDIKTGEVVWFGQVDEALGYERGEFPRTMDGWAQHVHPEDREVVQAAVEREVIDQRRGLSAEFRVRARDGSYRHWTVRAAPRREETRRPRKFVTVCADITEQTVARAEALQHRDALAHVARVSSLGELTATLAHELNQPLAAILSNAQAAARLLDREPPDAAQTREILADIVADDRRASAIIQRLRDMMRRDTATREPVDLGQMVREVREIMRSGLAIRGITVSTECQPDLPPVVADRIQIQQVVVNLVTNAMQALDGRPDPELSIVVRRRKDEWQVVSVVDSGVGIAPSMQSILFEPFTSTRADGLGIGLSISRTIVESFGGRTWAENQGQSGAIVSFALPPERP